MGFYRGPNIVTEGLVFAIDAATPRSFNVMPTTVEALVIAGGGGGGVGSNAGGGGGAGGVIHNTSYSLSSTTSFTVTVGAGGAGRVGRGSGTNGANSVFGALTAIGGGRGGGHPTGGGSTAPNSGGSGGGGAYNTAGAAGTSGQGFAGGTGAAVGGKPLPNDGGGGGGGAGAVGADAQGSGGPGGNGGAGATYSTSGFPVTYAGGGGGATNDSSSMSAGGSGGGGAGGSNAVPNKSGIAGLVNSGSGGGAGNGGGGSSGAGGSGIVIIRYLGIQKATGGNVTTVDGYTIHTFTSSGTFLLVDFVSNLVGSPSGTLINGITFDSANKGSWEFDGVDQKITAPLTQTFTSALTVETWYKSTDSSRSHLWNFGTTSSDNLNMNINDSGQTYWIYWQSGGANAIRSASPQLMDGSINQLVFVHEGNTNKLYLNGELLTPTTTSGTQTFSGIPGASYNIGNSPFYDGNVYVNRVYNASLTAAQVLQNYNALKNRFI